MKNPYEIIKSRYFTEKATVLEGLQSAESNVCVARCQSPKYVFLVDPGASKQEIGRAVEEIYKDNNIKVVRVNTIRCKAKPRRVRGRKGFKAAFKKAIVTLEPNDTIEKI